MTKVESLVNLSEYPINEPQCAQFNEVVQFVQSELDKDGCSVLSKFLTNKGLELIAQEVEQRKLSVRRLGSNDTKTLDLETMISSLAKEASSP